MPVWHDATAQWVKEGKLAIVGVTQEQHAERGRLFAQWKQFDWPILNDPINLLEPKAVPILVAIDEHGIVRQVGPKLDRFEREFIEKQFDDDAPLLASEPKYDLAELRDRAEETNSVVAWMRYGDALALWAGPQHTTDAIEAYRRAVLLEPSNGLAHFRLGVCYRRRFESDTRQAGDFQSAADAWGRALELDPNQYIWRRRIQQYGPRLDKPYAFYDWISRAQSDIRGRGERPIELAVLPQAAELAQPTGSFAHDSPASTPPDPEGRVQRDSKLVEVEVATVPSRVSPGQTVQIHVQLRPHAATAHWNNESEPLRLWLDAPDGWQLSRRLLVAPQGPQPESREMRALDVEAKVPDHAIGPARLKGYALYYVCEQSGGQCLFLRQDITIPIDVRK